MLHFLQWDELEEVARVQDEGANEYGRDNWKNGTPEDYLSAGLRHIAARLRGEIFDMRSGRPHLAHAIANLLFAFWLDGTQRSKSYVSKWGWGARALQLLKAPDWNCQAIPGPSVRLACQLPNCLFCNGQSGKCS